MYLSPMEIRFTQSSISEQFRDGSLMMELFQDLVTGNEHPDSIDDIKCVRWKKKYWAIDGNRRLLLYKKLEKEGFISAVHVEMKPFIPHLFFKKFTTKNDGVFVRCRDNPHISQEMNQIVEDWRHPDMRWSSDEQDDQCSCPCHQYRGHHNGWDDSDSDSDSNRGVYFSYY